MAHQTTVSRRWDDSGKPYWWARCTCARWEIATHSQATAQAKAAQHEKAAR